MGELSMCQQQRRVELARNQQPQRNCSTVTLTLARTHTPTAPQVRRLSGEEKYAPYLQLRKVRRRVGFCCHRLADFVWGVCSTLPAAAQGMAASLLVLWRGVGWVVAWHVGVLELARSRCASPSSALLFICLPVSCRSRTTSSSRLSRRARGGHTSCSNTQWRCVVCGEWVGGDGGGGARVRCCRESSAGCRQWRIKPKLTCHPSPFFPSLPTHPTHKVRCQLDLHKVEPSSRLIQANTEHLRPSPPSRNADRPQSSLPLPLVNR